MQLPYISLKNAIVLLVYIQEVIAFLPADDCAILYLYNQYTGDSILLIGKILQ